MTVTDLVPRRTFTGVVAVWVFAAFIALAVGLIAPPDWRAAWMAVGLGVCILASFIVHLWFGRSQGFIERVAASMLGALLVMGLIGVGFGLATLFSG